MKAEKDEERKGEDVENISLFPAIIGIYYKQYSERKISPPLLYMYYEIIIKIYNSESQEIFRDLI